jgi:hypothetical protein
MSWATSSPGMAISQKPKDADENDSVATVKEPGKKTKVVVVGLGMVGIAFM